MKFKFSFIVASVCTLSVGQAFADTGSSLDSYLGTWNCVVNDGSTEVGTTKEILASYPGSKDTYLLGVATLEAGETAPLFYTKIKADGVKSVLSVVGIKIPEGTIDYTNEQADAKSDIIATTVQDAAGLKSMTVQVVSKATGKLQIEKIFHFQNDSYTADMTIYQDTYNPVSGHEACTRAK